MKIEHLKGGIWQGKITCFADDILMICDDKQEAERLIRQIESFSDCGLKINKAKTKVISDRNELKEAQEIAKWNLWANLST